MKPKIDPYILYKKQPLIQEIKMAYYTLEELKKMNFRDIGKNVNVSDKASIYNCNQIEIGDNSRIDDFCVVSGNITIGKNVHITPMCLVAGVKVFTQSDDYSGKTMVNSTIPSKFKDEFKKEVILKKHSIVGAGSIILPGVILAEGTSVGAMSLILSNTEPWSIYIGSPAKRLKNRNKDLLWLEIQYLNEMDIN